MTEQPSPLWEVFVRARRGLSHTHVGSLHAPDAVIALRNARDLYTRRQEGVSIWVVPATAICSQRASPLNALAPNSPLALSVTLNSPPLTGTFSSN